MKRLAYHANRFEVSRRYFDDKVNQCRKELEDAKNGFRGSKEPLENHLMNIEDTYARCKNIDEKIEISQLRIQTIMKFSQHLSLESDLQEVKFE